MSIYEYLQKETTALHLTEADAAILLMAHQHIHFDELQLKTLVGKIHGRSMEWIMESSLCSATLRLLALAKYNSNLLDGAMMALYVKRLIAVERSPGGPYKVSDSESEIITNTAIAQLFTVLKVPLQKTEQYIHVEMEHLLAKEMSNTHAWILFWPHNFSSNKKIYPDDSLTNISAVAHGVLTLPKLKESKPSKLSPNATALQILDELKSLHPLLHSTSNAVWNSIVAADKHSEITLLSSYFATSLLAKTHLQDADLLTLNKANFYSWMAYTQYDDFIDNEGVSLRLPIANIAHRKAYALYHKINLTIPRATNHTDTYFDQMDHANLWELTYCRHLVVDNYITITRLPLYRNKMLLARRAGAHILGPVIVLESCKTITPKQRNLIHRFLTHYLIARQINDDLHDWKEDLARGHSSFVVTFLLRKTKTLHGKYSIVRLTEVLQTYFWKSGLKELHEIILHHTNNALNAASSSDLFSDFDNQFITMTVQPIIDSVARGANSIDDQKAFLNIYSRELS